MKQMPVGEVHQDGRFRKVISALAAVLVVGVLLGGAFVLFHRLSSQAASGAAVSSGELGQTITAVSSAGGLEMSMKLTAGPYFLSEMLAADISLTNHTSSMKYVGLPFGKDPCGYWSGIIVTGGNEPNYTIPIATDHSCPPVNLAMPLKPGQTLTVHKYVPLTSSGKQTLTAQTTFYSGSGQGVNPFPTQISSLLEQHWPTLHIDVSPTVPSNRQLSFSKKGAQIVVSAPGGNPVHLVYLYGVRCSNFNNDGGGTGTGNYGWEPLATNRVSVPGCPGKNLHWNFAFGAPGYGIVTGSSPSS